MDLHRVKHIPSGLYYQPGENNFSEKGKIYSNNQDVLSGNCSHIGISMVKTSKVVKKYPDVFKDWEDSIAFNDRIFKSIIKDEFIREPIETK